MPKPTPRSPEILYSRTAEFVRLVSASPDAAVAVQGVIVGVTAHLTGVVDYPSWTAFKDGFRKDLPDIAARVLEWAERAFADGDSLAGWAYDLVSINLATFSDADPAAVSAEGMTSAIIRKALSDANPFDHSEPESGPEPGPEQV